MRQADLVLGIDSSTQGSTAVLLAIDGWSVAGSARIAYREMRSAFGLDPAAAAPLLPAIEPGEASQPPGMYLRALSEILDRLGPGLLSRVAAVNVSAQQHGQVWLSARGADAIAALGGNRRDADAEFKRHFPDGEPGAFPADGFSLPRAPIWMCSDTAAEASRIRDMAGGREAVTARSGSDSPLRFSGAVARRMATLFPEAYARTGTLHLISSFLTGWLSGSPRAPIDWGNGAGTSLMGYATREWDPLLAEAVAGDLPGGASGLLAKLPPLSHPLASAGTIASHIAKRYGFPDCCRVVAGSGDNPQSKVLASGALLSLGTSFVLMSPGDRPQVSANAMYDGLGDPFLFGCRTNGSLAWESVRARHGMGARDFAASDAVLAALRPGDADPSFIFQPEPESFPESPARIPCFTGFAADYPAAVDSSLGLMYVASRDFAGAGGGGGTGAEGGVAVTGGAAASAEVLARVAAIWNAPAFALGEAGAATGAAVAAGAALVPDVSRPALLAEARLRAGAVIRSVQPDPRAVEALHGPGGYMERLSAALESARKT